jgi:hypothetical protein
VRIRRTQDEVINRLPFERLRRIRHWRSRRKCVACRRDYLKYGHFIDLSIHRFISSSSHHLIKLILVARTSDHVPLEFLRMLCVYILRLKCLLLRRGLSSVDFLSTHSLFHAMESNFIDGSGTWGECNAVLPANNLINKRIKLTFINWLVIIM